MVLADFSGIPAGRKGFVCEIYDGGIMIVWEAKDQQERARWAWQPPLRDGFSTEDLQYLVFETQRHPSVSPEVCRYQAYMYEQPRSSN